MRKQEILKKLTEEQKKDDTCFVSPEKIPAPNPTTNCLNLISFAEYLLLAEQAGLTNTEKIFYLLKIVFGFSNRSIKKILSYSHTTVGKNINSAREKLQEIIKEIKPAKKEETLNQTDRKQIEEIFRKFANHERKRRVSIKRSTTHYSKRS